MLAFAVGFGAQDALAQRTVTLHLNTASAPDTLTTWHEVQVRGSLWDAGGGVDGANTLPDGNVINWGDDTTLRPMNMGGDYWYVSFQIPDDHGLWFKFWATLVNPDHNMGVDWEDGDNHIIDMGTGDVEMDLHFFNKSGGDQDDGYEWRPYEPAGTDSIAVWFRVFAYTDGSVTAGYDRADAAQTAEVRGDPATGGPLTWDAMTGVKLAKEGTDDTKPSYDLYSGVGYFPASAAGMEQQYKFVVGADGWESSDNRIFTIPSADTTLHWVYFANTDPITEALVEGSVIFAVDTKPLQDINVFDLARGDSLEVRGDFNGWNCGDPTLCQLLRVPGSTTFENPVVLTLVSGAELSYKFYINFHDANFENAFGVTTASQGGGFGWEEPITRTGANRMFTFGGIADQDLGVQYFNDIADANIIPPGTSVELTMRVDMTSALKPVTADPFDPARDSVVVSFNDAIWRFTMNLPRTDEDGWRNDGRLYLLDPDGDNVYEATVTIGGVTRNDIALGTYSGLQYKYQYINPDAMTESGEQGGGFGDLGRNRVRYIHPNADGSWPASFTFETDMYQEEGLLPFEMNPVSVEPVGAELPTQVTLGANYPNPFNPVTTFEYAIDQTLHVTLKVYDTLGREVATLVDGVQQAANYQVRFDGSGLASGMYLYRLETPGQVLTRRMILMK